MLNISIDIIIIILIHPLLPKVINTYSHKIRDIFWDSKMDYGVFGQIQKILDTKQACILKCNWYTSCIKYHNPQFNE